MSGTNQHDDPTDDQLWSWVDGNAPELDAYLAEHPEAAPRVAELRAAIGLFESVDPDPRLPERIGEYRILGLLGRGGMGCVFDAEQEHPKRRVALKVLPLEVATDERRLELFRREANALARLSHPGIAAIYAVGRGEDGRPHIAMERIAGRPLGVYAQAEQLSRRARILLVRKVCEAISHAHDQGVVHRDIKPANVLVDTHGEPVVVDFGLARIEDEDLTRATEPGALLGTLPYMSPEQISGAKDLDQRSDVYSLGVLLFELITGELPHELRGLPLLEAVRRIQRDPPKLRRSAARALRGDLRTVSLKALEKDPRRRYGSAGALAADLQRTLDGRPIEAVDPPLLRRSLRYLRRHWIGTTFAALLFGVALLLVVPSRLPLPFLASWWREGSPFDDVRWVRDTPEVLVEGQWYGLVAIDDLQSAYVVGFCQQNAAGAWRKRFSEELVQVLNRLGKWGVGDVDLTLRDLETGALVVQRDVALDPERRFSINQRRNTWPWAPAEEWNTSPSMRKADWELVSVEGLPTSAFLPSVNFDSFCDRMGVSPGPQVDFVLRNTKTGQLVELSDVARITPERLEPRP